MKAFDMAAIARRGLRRGGKARRERIIDIPKSGRDGEWVNYRLVQTQCRRRYVVPRNPRTAAQRQARRAVGNAAKAWGTKLDEAQRAAWSRLGAQEWSKPRLGQSGSLTGEQVFTRHSSVLATVGKEMLWWPTARPVFGPNPVAALVISNGKDGVRIKLRVSGPLTDDVRVFAQAPCSAGRKKWRHGALLCLLPAPEGGESDITAQYVARYGEPEPGKKVFIRTRQQRDGWQDVEKDISEVVPAQADEAERRVSCGECGMAGTESRHTGGAKLNWVK